MRREWIEEIHFEKYLWIDYFHSASIGRSASESSVSRFVATLNVCRRVRTNAAGFSRVKERGSGGKKRREKKRRKKKEETKLDFGVEGESKGSNNLGRVRVAFSRRRRRRPSINGGIINRSSRASVKRLRARGGELDTAKGGEAGGRSTEMHAKKGEIT